MDRPAGASSPPRRPSGANSPAGSDDQSGSDDGSGNGDGTGELEEDIADGDLNRQTSGWEEDAVVHDDIGWEEDLPLPLRKENENAVAEELAWEEDGVWEDDGADGGWEEAGGDEEQSLSQPERGSSFGSSKNSAEEESGSSEEWEEAGTPAMQESSEEAESLQEDSLPVELSGSVDFVEKRLPVLAAPLLAEVRWLAHKVAQSSSRNSEIDIRPQPDETARLLALLMQLPTFNAALSQLRPRARLVAVSCLAAQHLAKGADLLSGYQKLRRMEDGQVLGDPHQREEEDDEELASNTESFRDGKVPGKSQSLHSISSRQQPIDIACLVLAGSAVFLVEDGLSKDEEILPGSEVSSQDLAMRLPKKSGASVRGIASGTEILSLPEDLLEMAAAEEEVREESRVLVLESLRCSEPYNREIEDEQAIKSYLKHHVACFANVEEEILGRLCQQIQLIGVPAGECVLFAGSRPDGLRVVLRGTAAIRWPGTASGQVASPQVLRCSEAWFCEDDSLGDWELCCQQDRNSHSNVADVIAVDEDGCQILFVPRSAYEHLLRQQLGATVLGQAAVQALCILARSEHESIQPIHSLLSPYSPFLVPQEPDVLLGEEPHEDSTLLANNSSVKSLLSHKSQSMKDGSGRGSLSENSGNANRNSRLTQRTPSGATLPSMLEAIPSYIEPEENSALFHSVQQWALETAVAAGEAMVQQISKPPALLQVLPYFTRSQLYSKAKLWRASQGEVIYRSGDQADTLFLVIRGQVGLFDRRERQAAVKDRRTEIFRCVPSLANEHLWTHGVPPDDKALQWLAHFNASDEGTSKFSPLAACLLETMARRWKGLPVPELGSTLEAGKQKLFISSAELEKHLLGKEAYWTQGEAWWKHTPVEDWRAAAMQGENYLDLDQLGLFTAEVGPGESLGAGAPGALEAVETQRYSAVSLSARTDILVIDQEAVAEVLAGMGKHLPPMQVLAESLRQGCDYTPRDLHILSKLLCAHQTFVKLESRVHADVCRRAMKYITVKAGGTLCKQGDKAVRFYGLLSGSASVFAVGSKLNQPDADVDRPEGALVLRLGSGSCFGEDALSRDQDCVLYDYTVVADEDVEVAVVEADVFRTVSSDWCGSCAARRRAVEITSASSGGRLEELGTQTTQEVQQVLKDTPLFKQLCAAERIEVAKQASVLPVPLGGLAFDLPKGEVPPFCFVLKGCVGQYPVTQALNISEPSAADRLRTQKTKALEREQEQLFRQQQALLIRQREVQRLRQTVAKLAQQQARNPLGASLEQRLRLHSLRRRLAGQILELGADVPDEDAELPEPELADAAETDPESSGKRTLRGTIGKTSMGIQESSSPIKRPSAWTSGVVKAAMKTVGLHSKVMGRKRPSPAEGGSSFDFLTSVGAKNDDANVADEEDLVETMNSSTAQYYEGDFFGGWQEQLAASQPALYRAHVDSILLIISRGAYEHAMRLHEKARLLERGEFLNRSLPVTLPKDALERLVALFKEEPKPKDTVIVRKGVLTTSVWLIVQGSCICRGSDGSRNGRDEQESRRTAHGGLMLHPKDGMGLGTLEEGEFIGLSSVLLQQPEPLTVVTSSRVILLRADQFNAARLTQPLLEALKNMVRAKTGWHESRLLEVARIPGQVNNEAERIRHKMQEAYRPSMLDSPFLRRKDQVATTPGLFALDSVCRHFGNDAHSESEWAFTPQIRSFYINIRLANASVETCPGMKALVEYEGEDRKAADKEKEAGEKDVANSRFAHYQKLTRSHFETQLSTIMERSAAESVSLAAATTGTSHLSQLVASKGLPSQLTSHGGNLEPPGAPISGPAAGPPPSASTETGYDGGGASSARGPARPPGSPKDGAASDEESVLLRKKPVLLRSTSRAFQASDHESEKQTKKALKSETRLNQVRANSASRAVTHADDIHRNKSGYKSRARQLQLAAQAEQLEGESGQHYGQAPGLPWGAQTARTKRILSPSDDGPSSEREASSRAATSRSSMAQGLRPLISSDALPQIASEKSTEEPGKMLPSKLRHLRARMPKFVPDVGSLGVGLPGAATEPQTPESTRTFRRRSTRLSVVQKAPSFRDGQDLSGLNLVSNSLPKQRGAFDVSSWGWGDMTEFNVSSGAATSDVRMEGDAG